MQLEHLRSLDLNLLIAFLALMEERSITGAARRMCVSQPAMSRMFDRLQTMLNDELLIRTPKGYEPTYRASAIFGELQAILPKVEAVLGRPDLYPTKTTGLFRIESTDWGATVLIPQLVLVVFRRLPGIQVDVISRQSGYEALESNQVDLILGGPPPRTGNDSSVLRTEVLLRDRLVCLVRRGHPLTKAKLTLREYGRAQHISLSVMTTPRRLPLSFAERQPTVAQALEELGVKPDLRVRVPYFVSLEPIVARSDLVATLPLHIARRVKSARTCIIPAPKEFQGVSFHQIWHSRNDASPIHEWIRGSIRQIAVEISKKRQTES
jgi:DNA-binding transcriptional LysR family regulator